MKTSSFIIAGIILMIFFSCKKEDIPWGQEDHLIADTAFAIQEVRIINETPMQYTFELDLVQLNGSNSEETYADLNLSFNGGYYSNAILSESVEPPALVSQYSTIVLLQASNTSFYEENRMSFGIRRFFEMVDADENKNLALVSRKKEANTIIVHQLETDPFSNTADFNNAAFHELLAQESYNNNNGSGEDFRDQMIATIALFDECTSCTGQKSITIFDDYDGNYYSTFEATDSIVELATAANIQINVVCNALTRSYSDLALQTGGVIISKREGSNINGEETGDSNSLGLFTQNLDAFLSHALTTHQYVFTLSKADATVFSSGETHTVNGVYNEQTFDIIFSVP